MKLYEFEWKDLRCPLGCEFDFLLPGESWDVWLLEECWRSWVLQGHPCIKWYQSRNIFLKKFFFVCFFEELKKVLLKIWYAAYTSEQDCSSGKKTRSGKILKVRLFFWIGICKQSLWLQRRWQWTWHSAEGWIERTTEVFSGESGRLQKPRRSKGVAHEEVPDGGPCLPKD